MLQLSLFSISSMKRSLNCCSLFHPPKIYTQPRGRGSSVAADQGPIRGDATGRARDYSRYMLYLAIRAKLFKNQVQILELFDFLGPSLNCFKHFKTIWGVFAGKLVLDDYPNESVIYWGDETNLWLPPFRSSSNMNKRWDHLQICHPSSPSSCNHPTKPWLKCTGSMNSGPKNDGFFKIAVRSWILRVSMNFPGIPMSWML